MENVKPVKTPMASNGHLDLNEGSLLYLCASRLDIMLSVCMCARFQANPKDYSDSDYAVCKVDEKSTTRTCQFLGRSFVSWSSKKQNSVALSTAEAEYVVAGACCAQLLCMRQTMRLWL
ncbi:hypothetical protein U9M48_039602 [Paspalum notatum var. saurae]|uniref:Uncharacterized protein n=1 Tax=Paspalum notatum var. saurae TaxID=547442 RepID=A0AAQ3UNP5_PASNO